MWVKKRHKIFISIIRFIFYPYFKIRYKCSFDKLSKLEEPSLVVSNHVTTMDPFLIGCLFKDHLYYMATKDLYENKFLGKLIKFLVNPIPKEKSKKSDLVAIRNCINISKEGGSICIFPEGNRTFNGELCNVDESIAKLAKLLKRPLVICNILGGYATNPRWSKKIRKGEMKVTVKCIYKYEEIKDLSVEEIYKLIVDGINVDNFNSDIEYKSKKNAEYLERVFYICPKCGQMHKLKSNKEIIKCSHCGLIVKHNPDLTLTSDDKLFKFKYVKDWYKYQIDVMKSKDYLNNDIIYQDDGITLTLSRLFKAKTKIGKGTIKLYKDKFVLSLDKKEFEFKFEDIEACTILGQKKLALYVGSNTYQIKKDDRINLIKYMHLYYHLKNELEGKGSNFLGI